MNLDLACVAVFTLVVAMVVHASTRSDRPSA
jgi:hypothetical protein